MCLCCGGMLLQPLAFAANFVFEEHVSNGMDILHTSAEWMGCMLFLCLKTKEREKKIGKISKKEDSEIKCYGY